MTSHLAEWLAGVGSALFIGVAAGAAFWLIIIVDFPGDREEHALCDRAIDALVHSNDLVEVTRAGIIIRELNCSIGRRLRHDGRDGSPRDPR